MSTKTRPDAVLLPVSEAARRIGLHANTITRAIEDGELPTVKFRGRQRVSAALLDYVISAVNSGRDGSVAQFAAEFRERPASA